MHHFKYLFKKVTILAIVLTAIQHTVYTENSFYPHNTEPMIEQKFIPLPLGAVKPQGWLKDQLKVQAQGLTGHLDEFWPDLVNSSWRGKDGEHWERGPYYLDGLVPLAYLLEDERLIAKVQEWMDAILASPQENGWFGPKQNRDRWPLAVAMKVLMQYYEASGDQRALDVMKGYARYLHENEPDWPAKDWRGVRAMENSVPLYWLYRHTGDPKILEVVASIHNNSPDWTGYFLDFPWTREALQSGQIPRDWKTVGMTAHVVNIAMAIKYPGLWYQQSKDEKFMKAVYEGIASLDEHHGQVAGRFSGDEHLSGKKPTQGTELCGVVEYMYSLENLIPIFGDVKLADRLEILAYNANPGATTADYWAHQYDQQANQVLCTIDKRDWSTNGDASNIFGLEPNFGCCTANMHQGWPKFVSHLWMATPDNGLAAVAYGPSEVKAKVGNGEEVTITEITDYPFKGSIELKISIENETEFPLVLRRPEWSRDFEGPIMIIHVNGEKIRTTRQPWEVIRRTWNDGDTITVALCMDLRQQRRYNGAFTIMRGPLVFSLRVEDKRNPIAKHHETFPAIDWQLTPASPWNYAIRTYSDDPESLLKVEERSISSIPFDPEQPPVIIHAQGRRVPLWGLENNSAGDTPVSPVKTSEPLEEITLVPYASTQLRITEIPVLSR